jgi:hypothetical protein
MGKIKKNSANYYFTDDVPSRKLCFPVVNYFVEAQSPVFTLNCTARVTAGWGQRDGRGVGMLCDRGG